MQHPPWRYALAKRLFKQAGRLAPVTRVPVLGKGVHRFFSGGDAGRVIPVDQAIAATDNVVLPSRAVRKAVEAAGHRFLMRECMCRRVEDCSRYPADLGCLFLGEATRTIHPRLGRMVSAAEALEHLDRCRAAGLVHVMGHFRFDALFLEARPFEKLLSICNCCECCCIFKVFPRLHKPIGDTLKKQDGVEVRVDESCAGCGSCLDACFVNAISIGDMQASISSECRGCGRCVSRCPNNAITLFLGEPGFPESLLGRIA